MGVEWNGSGMRKKQSRSVSCLRLTLTYPACKGQAQEISGTGLFFCNTLIKSGV